MPNTDHTYFKHKVAEKRNRIKGNRKRAPAGSRVRYKKEKGHIISIKKRSTSIMVDRPSGEVEIIVPGRPHVIQDEFRDLKSPTNFHKKKRMRVKDQTHKPNKIDYIEGITVPQANRKTDNYWDCGRWDYKIRL